MSAEAFATLPTAFEEVARTAATPKGKKTNQRRLPKVLYNGMIAPLVPYALRGMLWYQGEGNANAVFPEMTENYAQNFQTLITDWRRVFGQGDLPFYFVQLPNFRTGNPDSGIWPRVRAAQEQALRLPATGMAVTIDVGDPRDIHPRNKKVVGERLALVALKHTYQKDVVANGPTLIGHRVHRNRVKLRFDQTVQLKPGSDPAFEIAGPDGAFTPARAAARNNEVHLVNDSVEQPVFVRYAWSNNPTASVFNATGLPAAPFQVKLDERAP